MAVRVLTLMRLAGSRINRQARSFLPETFSLILRVRLCTEMQPQTGDR